MTRSLAFVGLLVLVGDVWGDLQYFALPERRAASLVTAAVFRNLLTLAALVAVFRTERWCGYLLLLAGLLGLARRGAFLLPLVGAGQDWIVFTSGLDVAFRFLLIGLAAGYLLARSSGDQA